MSQRNQSLHVGHCEAGERCSCPPGSDHRARCSMWHAGKGQPLRKVFGLLMEYAPQQPHIQAHCFGDCGRVSMAGVIHDAQAGGLWVCTEQACPWLDKQMDEPLGSARAFGETVRVYLRLVGDKPTQPEAKA